MLILTRKVNERIRIADDIWLVVVQIRESSVRLGIDAPRDVKVLRGELTELERDSRDLDRRH